MFVNITLWCVLTCLNPYLYVYDLSCKFRGFNHTLWFNHAKKVALMPPVSSVRTQLVSFLNTKISVINYTNNSCQLPHIFTKEDLVVNLILIQSSDIPYMLSYKFINFGRFLANIFFNSSYARVIKYDFYSLIHFFQH